MPSILEELKKAPRNIRTVRERLPAEAIKDIRKLGVEPRQWSWREITDAIYRAHGVKITQNTVIAIAKGR